MRRRGLHQLGARVGLRRGRVGLRRCRVLRLAILVPDTLLLLSWLRLRAGLGTASLDFAGWVVGRCVDGAPPLPRAPAFGRQARS